jgi:hypothetical protein
VRLAALVGDDDLLSAQVICGLNRTRVRLNERVRRLRGGRDLIEPGERVISLLNDGKLGLFNGGQAQVVGVQGQTDMVLEDEHGLKEVRFLPEVFGMDKYPDYQRMRSRGHPFDYAYVLRCHPGQRVGAGGRRDRHVPRPDQVLLHPRSPVAVTDRHLLDGPRCCRGSPGADRARRRC